MPKTKKKTKQQSNTTWIILICILVPIACAVGFFIAQRYHNASDDLPQQNNTSSSSDTDEIVNISGENSFEAPEQTEKEDKTPAKYDGNDANTYENLTGFVTYVGKSGDKLMIRVSIDQYLSSGSCVLELGDYTASANISASAATSTCEGFDIPLSALGGLSGDVDFVINLASGEKIGTINGSANL